MLPEVRMARVLGAISSHRAGRLSCVEAGELLGFSERHFRRLRDAFEERGEYGLIDRRRVRVSARAADEAEAAWVAEMFRTRYFDFRIKHFHEQIVSMPMASGNARAWISNKCYSLFTWSALYGGHDVQNGQRRAINDEKIPGAKSF